MSNPLYERAVSSYPISIGTALALESIHVGNDSPYDPNREIPEIKNYRHYDELWINLATLVRNILGAIATEKLDQVNGAHIAEILIEETQAIQQIAKDHGKVGHEVVFYSCAYKGLIKEYPVAQVRSDSTERQKRFTRLVGDGITRYYHHVPPELRVHFDLKIKGHLKPKCLMLSHYAHDLLAENFRRLDLLESHTGKVKGPWQWNTKLSGGDELARIPFHKVTLQIFGDGTLFRPNDSKLRKAVLDIAQEYNWTPSTTADRMRLTLGYMPDRYLYEIIKRMF